SELPGENKPTFQLTSILTPLKRQTLASFVSVSSDPKNYGDITVLQWPSERQNRSEEHTSELQSRFDLVCRLLLEKINISIINYSDIRVRRRCFIMLKTKIEMDKAADILKILSNETSLTMLKIIDDHDCCVSEFVE